MFEPIYPAHAVESCAITLFFGQAVPSKPFAKIREEAAVAFTKDRYIRQQLPGYNIDPQGKVQPVPAIMLPIQFIGIATNDVITFADNYITFHTSQYIRWLPFLSTFKKIISSYFSYLFDIVEITGVKLEYADRFFWTKSWESMDINLLLEASDMQPMMVFSRERQWHNHSGWFENATSPTRRLINVNVDVIDAHRPNHPTPVPSVGISTFIHDQPNSTTGHQPTTWTNDEGLSSHLNDIHSALKSLLGTLIKREIQERIRLFEDARL